MQSGPGRFHYLHVEDIRQPLIIYALFPPRCVKIALPVSHLEKKGKYSDITVNCFGIEGGAQLFLVLIAANILIRWWVNLSQDRAESVTSSEWKVSRQGRRKADHFPYNNHISLGNYFATVVLNFN